MIAIKFSLPKGCVLCYYWGVYPGEYQETGAGGAPPASGNLAPCALVCCSGHVGSPHFFLCKIELVVLCNACVDL